MGLRGKSLRDARSAPGGAAAADFIDGANELGRRQPVSLAVGVEGRSWIYGPEITHRPGKDIYVGGVLLCVQGKFLVWLNAVRT